MKPRTTAQSALDGKCQSGEGQFIADGKGKPVKNNAASACNKDDNPTARANTYNENASFKWIA